MWSPGLKLLSLVSIVNLPFDSPLLIEIEPLLPPPGNALMSFSLALSLSEKSATLTGRLGFAGLYGFAPQPGSSQLPPRYMGCKSGRYCRWMVPKRGRTARRRGIG
jgi:hypothetical protein